MSSFEGNLTFHQIIHPMTSSSRLENAYRFIRQQIEAGLVRPGQRLSRRKLAEEIGVSSAIVQQALAQLDREGITQSLPRSGTYVRELSATEFANLCDVRELLEPHAAACAASRITAEEIAILRDSCRRYQQLHEERCPSNHAVAEWLLHCRAIQEELVFHGTILRASGNEILANLVSTLRLLSHVGPRLVYGREREGDQKNSPLVVVDEHEGIINALEARDPERARERMLHHIRGARILIDPDLTERFTREVLQDASVNRPHRASAECHSSTVQ